MKTKQIVKFSTVNGEGEAIKEKQGEYWGVSAPEGDFRFYGTVAELKRRIQEYCNCEVRWL